MGDRRRNLFILLVVAGLAAASLAILATHSVKRGLDLKGGVELVYQGRPTPQQPKVDSQAIDRALDVIRKRVDAFGVSEPEIQRSGSDQIAVGLPGTKNAQRAVRQVGKVAQLQFYDWEADVLGPNLKANPSDTNVTGGQAAGSAGGFPFYDAVVLAAKRPPTTNNGEAPTNGEYYLVNDQQKKVLAGPAEVPTDLTGDLPGGQPRKGTRIAKVNPGTIVVRGEKNRQSKKAAGNYYVLNDAPALSGTDLTDVKQDFNRSGGGNGAPIVTFSFTDKGRSAWQKVTRTIAQRGQEQQAPGQSPQQSFQHFAAVLDGELVTVPYIDFQQNPDGIDGANGADIEGGFTIQSAQDLAKLLQIGALP